MLIEFALLTVAHLAPVADSIQGTWKISGDVMGTAFGVVCTIKQTAAELSGNCVDDAGLPHPLTGEVKDGKISFKYGVDYQGQPLTVVYAAAFASPTQLKGTLVVQPFGSQGTFTAASVPAKP